jgi:hypothetical protein
MRWSEVTARPPERMLRQFAGLFLVFFLALAAWRLWDGNADVWTAALAAVGVTVGLIGLARPTAVRWIYTGWMVAAFPVGWTVSRVALGIVFYGLLTPMAAIFRVKGRDVLFRKRPPGPSFWRAKPRPDNAASYFRQF